MTTSDASVLRRWLSVVCDHAVDRSRAGVRYRNSHTGVRTLDFIQTAFRGLPLILLCLPISAFALDLDDYRWRNRLLFLVAPEVADPVVEQVRDRLKRRHEELVDRDLLVFQLFIRGQSLAGRCPISTVKAEQIRARLGVTSDEQLLVLVGKDGGVKRRAPLLTDLRDIFRQIDSMPMRRDEMREVDRSGGLFLRPRRGYPSGSRTTLSACMGNTSTEELP